jgi:CheY-like chemotaxis protein
MLSCPMFHRTSRIFVKIDLPLAYTVSASASPDDQEASQTSGANAFLPKPIDFNRLLPHMARLLKLVEQYVEREKVSQGRD